MSTIQPHIRCSADVGAEYAILPGDPARVDRIKQYLTDIEDIAYNREYKTASGCYCGVRILVTSTGIGGPSTAIAVEELCNIGVKTMIRVGSCGALQPDIRLGNLIIPSGAVRDEGTSTCYIDKAYPAVPDIVLLAALIKAAEKQGATYHCGLVRSHDSFYTDREAEIDAYWGQKGVLAADMETAALLVVGRLRGLKTASLLNVVVEAQGQLASGINEYVDGETAVLKGETREILTALEAIAHLDKEIKLCGGGL